jgi:hypothetical protein
MSDAPSDVVGDRGMDADAFVCNPAWTPSDNNCVVEDSLGVFVSVSTGADGAAGTKAAPLKKLQDGIALAKTAGKRLYVCAGTYAENAVIDATKDGVKIYGGLSCSAWTYATSNVVKVAPATGYALKLDTLTVGAHVEDVEFDSADATAAGDSSVAVFANAAAAVSFKRVVIKAGNGVAGADGASTTNYANAQADSGNAATGVTAGGTKTCTCTNADQSLGAHGGQGDPTAAADGADGMPSLAENPTGLTPKHDGKRGTGGALGGNGCTNGDPGANPTLTAAGGGGATVLGALSASGWSNTGGAGSNGAIGKVAQGGGGGGGGIGVSTGGGGGGGCGGCGGGAATAGNAGGSSFALVSLNSTIALDACTLNGGNAANGGKGGDGQVGQTGGFSGTQSGAGCLGGQGGTGGAGGGGGGGAGGISAAIFYKGTLPTMTNGTATKGNGAVGGNAGANGSPAATAGLTTASQDVTMAP